MSKLETLGEIKMKKKARVLADSLSNEGLKIDHVNEVMSGNINLLETFKCNRINENKHFSDRNGIHSSF